MARPEARSQPQPHAPPGARNGDDGDARTPFVHPPPRIVEAWPTAERVDWAAFRRTGTNPFFPVAMQVETSSICDFECKACAMSREGYDRPKRHMSVRILRRVLHAFPTVRKIELQGMGEVFLNPCVLDLVREATDRGLDVHTFSNGSQISRGPAFAIVRSGLHLIHLSMDGADEETFQELRSGGTLDELRRAVTNLVEARSALASTTPTIGIMVVLSKRNYRQIPEMLAIAEALGVDVLTFTKMNGLASPRHAEMLLGEEELAWIRTLPPYDGRVEVTWAYEPWTTEQRRDCYWPRHMTYVTVDGDVTPCCNHYDSREVTFGNVLRQDGWDIWNNEAYRAFRRRLMAGDLPERCKRC